MLELLTVEFQTTALGHPQLGAAYRTILNSTGKTVGTPSRCQQ